MLIVDDEAFILQMTSAALEAAGYRSLTAQDGSTAIATFQQHCHEISAVLLDIMMPGLDGLQTLDELRKIVRTSRSSRAVASEPLSARPRFLNEARRRSFPNHSPTISCYKPSPCS